MSFIDERKALTREKRVSTLSHFNGALSALVDEASGTEIRQKIRTFSQVGYDEIIYALSVLSKIKNSATVIHGSIGCAASGLYFNSDNDFDFYSTHLNERDTILGGDEKLRRAVLRAYEEVHPKVIFIVGTPVVAINNDDVNSLILELQDELDVKIIYVYTDGFKSKTPLTGYDIVSHSLLKYIIANADEQDGETGDYINVISFSESKQNILAVLDILDDLGVKYNLLPQFADYNSIQRARYAKASITLSAEDGAYFASQLEEVFGVPYVKTKSPVGFRATRHFIQKLGKQLGELERFSEYVHDNEAKLSKLFVRAHLSDKSVFIDSKIEEVVGIAELTEKLGGTVSGLSSVSIDIDNRTNLDKLSGLSPSTNFIIGNGELFEKANLISKKEINFYIGGAYGSAFAREQGAIPVSLENTAYYGYTGLKKLVATIKNAERFNAAGGDKLYKSSWLTKSGNWYVKQEVK